MSGKRLVVVLFVFVLSITAVPSSAEEMLNDRSRHAFDFGISLATAANISVFGLGARYEHRFNDTFALGFPMRWFDRNEREGFDLTTFEIGAEFRVYFPEDLFGKPKPGKKKKGREFAFLQATSLTGDYRDEDQFGTIADGTLTGLRYVLGGGYSWGDRKGMITAIQVGIEYWDMDMTGGYEFTANRKARLHWNFAIGYAF
ncbi:hypothetical protein ACFL4W_01615 [Planctomycetota bacterium]